MILNKQQLLKILSVIPKGLTLKKAISIKAKYTHLFKNL